MYRKLERYLSSLTGEFELIDHGRRKVLTDLADYSSNALQKKGRANLIFICTHNSRRSHIGQAMARAASTFYGIKEVHSFSGGTEKTRLNLSALKVLRDAGFEIFEKGNGDNPEYKAYYDDSEAAISLFSKTYGNPINPDKDFCAVMTCSDADRNCPFIPGAEKRISLPYRDPKEADGTSEEHKIYSERTRQIAREMMYTFSLIS